MAPRNPTKLVETQQENEIAFLREALTESRNDMDVLSMRMEEKLSGLDLMMDQVGWSEISGFGQDDGPSLPQLKQRSKQIRNAVALSPHIKNGKEIRTNRVWSDPVRYENVPGLNGASTGRGTPDVGKFVNLPTNQHYVFGANARMERESALYSDGVYLLLGEKSSKKLSPIPLDEISADYRNPDNKAEIWAYRRQWNRWDGVNGRDVPMVRWYFTDLFDSEAVDSINYDGKPEKVDRKFNIIDGHVNTQSGWAYGFPDAGCVLEWAKKYSEFMRSGLKMTEAMARLWAQVKPATPAGGSVAGVKVASMEGFGNTAISTNELAPLSTAGKAYDFGAGTQVLAIVAAGLAISVITLSANPGDAGGSYGAAQTLSLPERLATKMRRDWHSEYDERILRWMGAKEPKAVWPVLVDGAELYRLKQSAQLDWNSGLYEPEEAKAKFEAAEGNFTPVEKSMIPDGVLVPNNEYSEPRSDIDPGGNSYAGPDSNQRPVQAGGTGQGVSNGTGGDQVANDTRSDTIV